MTRFKFFLSFDKEEKWLEKMSEQGWLLRKNSFLYRFERVEPQHRTIRIDYREFKNKRSFSDYLSMFEDSGWHHIAGTKGSGNQYFLKAGPDSTEDIFSDGPSRAGRYKRLADMWLCFALAFLPMVIGNGKDLNYLLAPKQWYLTPGLWELKGIDFLRAFLFETPFALFRGLGTLFFEILFLSIVIKSWLNYRREIKKMQTDI